LTNGGITSDYDTFEKQIKEYGSTKALLEQEYIDIRATGKGSQGEDEKENKAKGEESKNGVKAKT